MSDATVLGYWIRRFLLEHLVRERNLARNTQLGYRDAFALLVPFLARETGHSVDTLQVTHLSADVLRKFLASLENTRQCSPQTRNHRLAAIHAFARFVGEHSVEHIAWCVDEAQEMSPAVLGELRLMASRNFDSQMLLCVVLAGDNQLQEKLRREDLLPLGSRIRTRLTLDSATPEELRACLDYVLEASGNASLMTTELKQTLCDHALGNYRVLFGIANDLLLTAARYDLPQLDEKLFLQHTSTPQPRVAKRAAQR